MSEKFCSQSEFDASIGRLDRLLSELLLYGKNEWTLDYANQATLKHHAEDMVGAGNKILEYLGSNPAAEEAEELKRLREFKAMVHTKLDDLGVPADPYPGRTKETGCRVGSRLLWLDNNGLTRVGRANSGPKQWLPSQSVGSPQGEPKVAKQQYAGSSQGHAAASAFEASVKSALVNGCPEPAKEFVYAHGPGNHANAVHGASERPKQLVDIEFTTEAKPTISVTIDASKLTPEANRTFEAAAEDYFKAKKAFEKAIDERQATYDKVKKAFDRAEYQNDPPCGG